MLATTIMFAALAMAGQVDEEKWEVVTSKDGKFTVEMPATSDQSGSGPLLGPGGPVTLHETIRQTGGMIYIVGRMEARGSISRAEEARWLDFARDRAAGWFGRGGRVASEKNLQLAGVSGREFAVRRDVAGGGGTSHLRGRAYVKGSTVYVLMAASAVSNKPLPPKAGRFLESFAFGSHPEGTTGKPISKEKAEGGWEVVTAGGDKVSVEMPRKPNMEESGRAIGPPGEFDYQTRVAETRGADYAIMILTSPRPIVGPDVARVLNYARDEAADNFGSGLKLVSEKLIQVDGAEGREFTIKLDRPAVGMVNLRGRVFVRDRTACVLLAIPNVKNKELPADAGRFLESFAFKGRPPEVAGEVIPPRRPMAGAPAPFPGGGPTGPSVAAGMIPTLLAISKLTNPGPLGQAGRLLLSVGFRTRPPGLMARPNPRPEMGNDPPVIAPARVNAPPEIAPERAMPREAKAEATGLKLWGTPVDPDGDVRFRPSGRSLTLEIPGTAHLLAPERDKMNAPRVVAPISGDFVATVRVDGAFNPSRKSTVKGLSSRQAGGLIVWKDSGNYLVFQRRVSAGDEGEETNQAVLEELVDGQKGVGHRQPAADGPVYLRLERKGSRITAAYGPDGKSWRELKPVATTWAGGKVQVGVVAVNTSTGPHPVTFEGYSLKAR